MTLILGMSKPDGLYMSADFRVTEYPSRRVIDDEAVKLIDVHFSPIDTGTRGLIAFTGLARLPPSGLPLGQWIVETMRGESEVPDQAMRHLHARLNRDVAPKRVGLMVNMLLIEGPEGQRRLAGGFSNLKRGPDGTTELLPEFEYVMQELAGPTVIANGAPAWTPQFQEQLENRIRKQLKVRPRRAHDHMKLLAKFNRTIAKTHSTVSPACHVAFVPAIRPKPGESDNRFGPSSRSFAERGEHAPIVMPVLLSGIDLTPLMMVVHAQMAAMKSGTPPPEFKADEMNRGVLRRP